MMVDRVNVLVLGASGLLGQSLVKTLLRRWCNVGSLSRSSGPGVVGVKNHTVDILDGDLLDGVISQYDVIVNCVGQVTNPITCCLLLNTNGISNVVKSALKNKRKLIHISTMSVYGGAERVDESAILAPETVYGSLKCFSEYIIQEKLSDCTILRVPNLYGELQTKGLINYLVKSYREKVRELFFDNDGSMKRCYLHVDDLSVLIGDLIETKNNEGVYNVATKDMYTIKELICVCERIFGNSFDVNYRDILPPDNISTIEVTRLERLIFFKPTYSIESFLKGIMNGRNR